MPYHHHCNTQHHPESQLASLPGSSEDHDPTTLASADRETIHEETARGNLNELRSIASNKTQIISDRYCDTGDGVDSLESKVHDLWHIYYQAGKYLSHESPDHDRLVLEIIRIQGRGPLSRRVRGTHGCGIDVARTRDGTLWNDLPFLVSDMVGFWRRNFASFLAKLASTRVCKDRLCQIALFLFRATLEVSRDLGCTDDPDDEDARRTIDRLSIANLLPSVNAWLREAGCNLVQIADVSWNDCPYVVGLGGRLFVDWEMAQQPQTGFTPWRWMFWLKRLCEIEEAGLAGDKRLEKDAAESIESMLGVMEERNSHVLRVYETGGPGLHQDKHLLCLKRFLKEDDNSN